MKKTYYTWQQFDNDVTRLVRKLQRSKYKPGTIVGMARGGLPLAVVLSHRLHCPLLIVSAKTYADNKKQMDTVILNSSFTVPLKSPVLIVDEVADSGKTLQVLMSHFESCGVELKTLTLHYKPRSAVKPNFYADIKANEEWICYPWE